MTRPLQNVRRSMGALQLFVELDRHTGNGTIPADASIVCGRVEGDLVVVARGELADALEKQLRTGLTDIPDDEERGGDDPS